MRERRLASSVEDHAAGAVDVILKDGGTLRLRPPRDGDARRAARVLRAACRSAASTCASTASARSTRRSRERCSTPTGPSAARWPRWLGDRIVGVANYARLRDPRSAEAAFVVADEEQGRGIGTRLLEQLASAGAPRRGSRASSRRCWPRTGDARRLHRRRLRRRPRARARRGRGQLPDRADRDVPGARRGARPRRRRRLAAAVLRAAQRRRDRRLARGAARSAASSSATCSRPTSTAPPTRSTAAASPSPACAATTRSRRSPTRSSSR